MSDHPRRHLIAYDIADDRRRNQIAKRLQSYGVRVQYSVFLIDLKPAKIRRLLAMLEGMIDRSEDSVLVCDLGVVTQIRPEVFHYLGVSKPEPASGPVVI